MLPIEQTLERNKNLETALRGILMSKRPPDEMLCSVERYQRGETSPGAEASGLLRAACLLKNGQRQAAFVLKSRRRCAILELTQAGRPAKTWQGILHRTGPGISMGRLRCRPAHSIWSWTAARRRCWVSIWRPPARSAWKGSVYLTGRLGGQVSAECSNGNVRLALEDAAADYDYAISVNAGSVSLDGHRYGGMTNQQIDNGAGRTMKLSCRRGAMELDMR